MSAARDQKQGFTFVFTNLYDLYKKSNRVVDPLEIQESQARQSQDKINAQAQPFTPPKFETPAVRELRSNLENLQGLHSRLSFMLKELEDLVQKKTKS